MVSRTEHETMIKMTTSKNLLSISTLLFVCLTGAAASAAQNIDLENTEKADSPELASVRDSGSAGAFAARARGPVRLRQRQAHGMGCAAPEAPTDTLRRFQPAAQSGNQAPSTSCKTSSSLKRFGHIG